MLKKNKTKKKTSQNPSLTLKHTFCYCTDPFKTHLRSDVFFCTECCDCCWVVTVLKSVCHGIYCSVLSAWQQQFPFISFKLTEMYVVLFSASKAFTMHRPTACVKRSQAFWSSSLMSTSGLVTFKCECVFAGEVVMPHRKL